MVNKNISLGTQFYLQTPAETGTKCLSEDRASNFDEFNIQSSAILDILDMFSLLTKKDCMMEYLQIQLTPLRLFHLISKGILIIF